jgi:hypothetical protein
MARVQGFRWRRWCRLPLAGLGHRVGRARGTDDYALRAAVAAGSAACEHVFEPQPWYQPDGGGSEVMTQSRPHVENSP